jgi:hypothetical protein
MKSRIPFVVGVACLLALLGHIVAGHVHADMLSAVPLAHHEAGDEHHDVGPSCDSTRAASPSASAVVAVTAVLPFATGVVAILRLVAVEPPSPEAPPLFLLHAALLI